jgi:ubiquinone/menaquinone biosynthesis C-methylase UbiE
MMNLEDRGRGYWDRYAGRYDRSMALFGGPMPRMTERVAEAVSGAERVLEVAAGTGLVTRVVAAKVEHLVATDYSAAMVAELQARVDREALDNVSCEQADLYALSYDAGSFDAVVAANVLHLVPNLEGALAALLAMLRPGGRLVVPTYCHDEHAVSWIVSRLLGVAGFPGQRRLTLQGLEKATRSAGLLVRERELISGLLPIGFVVADLPEKR